MTSLDERRKKTCTGSAYSDQTGIDLQHRPVSNADMRLYGQMVCDGWYIHLHHMNPHDLHKCTGNMVVYDSDVVRLPRALVHVRQNRVRIELASVLNRVILDMVSLCHYLVLDAFMVDADMEQYVQNNQEAISAMLSDLLGSTHVYRWTNGDRDNSKMFCEIMKKPDWPYNRI